MAAIFSLPQNDKNSMIMGFSKFEVFLNMILGFKSNYLTEGSMLIFNATMIFFCFISNPIICNIQIYKYFAHFLTLYILNCSEGTKHIFTFYFIPPHWHDTGSWNPSSRKTLTYLFYIANIMASDALAPRVARASAAIIFTILNRINSVPVR